MEFVAYAKETYSVLQTLGFYVNNNSRSIYQGVRNKRMGITAGVFDFICLIRSGPHTALAIDFKVAPNKLSPKQQRFRDEAERQGVKCCVAYSFAEAKGIIDNYMAGDGERTN